MKAKWNISEITRMVDKTVEHGLDELANDIVKHAQQLMRQPGRGIDYSPGSGDPRAEWMPKDWRKQFRFRSSAPGQAPVQQHGGSGLLGSVQYVRTKRFTRHVGSNRKYALWLELGTRGRKAKTHTRIRMFARPWLRPAFRAITGRDVDIQFKGKLK